MSVPSGTMSTSRFRRRTSVKCLASRANGSGLGSSIDDEAAAASPLAAAWFWLWLWLLVFIAGAWTPARKTVHVACLVSAPSVMSCTRSAAPLRTASTMHGIGRPFIAGRSEFGSNDVGGCRTDKAISVGSLVQRPIPAACAPASAATSSSWLDAWSPPPWRTFAHPFATDSSDALSSPTYTWPNSRPMDATAYSTRNLTCFPMRSFRMNSRDANAWGSSLPSLRACGVCQLVGVRCQIGLFNTGGRWGKRSLGAAIGSSKVGARVLSLYDGEIWGRAACVPCGERRATRG